MRNALPHAELREEDPYRRWWDWFSALLLLALLETSASRLVSTNWAEDLGMVQNVVFWCAIAGLALGKSAFRPLTALLMSVNLGVFILGWQVGLLIEGRLEWDERLVRVAGRMGAMVQNILSREAVTDNLLFLFVMALVFGILSLYAGYQVVRYGHVWRVVLPPGLAAFIIQGFDNVLGRRAWSLGVYLFLALVLIARLAFLRMRRRWENTRAYIPPDIDMELGRVAIILTLVLVIFTWNFPSLASAVGGFADIKDAIERPWLQFKDRVSYMFNSLRSTAGLAPSYYDDQHSLGRGIPLSDKVMLRVEVPSYPLVGGRYYWRARAYDRYEGGLWDTSRDEPRLFDPELASRDFVYIQGRTTINARFSSFASFGTLITPSQPYWISRKGEFLVAVNPDDTLDLLAFNADPIVRAGEVYEVQASVTTVTRNQLRQAGTEYPEWVTARYLQLPEEITLRTRQLAEEITRPYDNPYDKAEAITQYLRENIEYVDEIEPPPVNQEVIDWFLFEYRKGFCNYYATAEVILLRAAGIPARWVVGYAQGEPAPLKVQPTFIPPDQMIPSSVSGMAEFIVRQSHAHAWPEVYFPTVGWVEFEPTVSFLPIIRPEDPSSLALASEEDRLRGLNRDLPEELEERQPPDQALELTDELLKQRRRRQVMTALAVAGSVSGLIFWRWARNPRSRLHRLIQRISKMERLPFVVLLERLIRQLGFTPPRLLQIWAAYSLVPMLGRAYQEINAALKRLGKPAEVSATPAERARLLMAILPEASTQTERLLAEYHAFSYSTHPANTWTARLMADDIRRLSRQAKIRNLLNSCREALVKKFEV